MAKKLNREDYRRIKNYSRDEMEKWLDYHESMIYNILRKEFEKNYQDEIENSISNFLIAIWYTLHYNEDLHLKNDELASFMEDLYVSVDLFRKGEYKPDDYKQQMEDDGISFTPCDYTKIYREKEGLVSGAELQEKLITFSEEEIQSVEDENKISGIKRNLPVYISIDKDILDEEYSETNWSQGKMPLPVLERLLIPFLTSGNILGIDICGECQQGIPLPQYLEAEKINGETNKELFDFLMHYCRNF